MENAVIDLKPVHLNDPLSNKASIAEEPEPDYQQIQIARAVVKILKGALTFEDLSYVVDKNDVKMIMAVTMVKLDAMDIKIPETAQQFMIAAFIDDIKTGVVQLVEQPELGVPA
jgi:hypothetical protein